ncbi:hypothetical protein [Thalassobacillus sp. CUG 92003]|uniref:hypothetical protein n=1 Tax=Thalassobacillus sp. CUG 92003 TaxID=2736641 RepID=UPI0015E6DF57|nr:hypothetical protein [Thalassobacillus sp. CUG 92003]
MGYILPVQPFQYQDYQNRTVQRDATPFTLERVFKATLDSKLTDNKKEHPREEDRKEYQELSSKIITTSHVHAAESTLAQEVYADVTGKGGRFSESI